MALKLLLSNYSFVASTKKITLSDYAGISLEDVIFITNVTSNVIIYDFTNPLKGGTVSTNVLTLTYDTSSMNNADKLQIWYYDSTATVAISGTVTANAGMNLNTSALALETGGNLAAIKADVDKIPSLGQALAASSVPVTLTALEEGLIGALTETAPATDTASSGLNGRLQRIAQRITTLIASTITVVIAAGTALIGKVGLDQTTPGTTNAVSLAQIGSTTVDGNSGNKSGGTQRVVIATDQPALTNKLLVTPDSVALPANQSVNVNQWAGGTAINSGVTGAPAVGGDTAAAATDGGNPVKIGGLGKTTNPTSVTDGQRVAALFDKNGKQVVVGAIRDLKGIQQTNISSSTSETTIVTALASTFLDLYMLLVTNNSATVCKVTIKDSTAGTTRFVIEVPATETRGFTLSAGDSIPQATVNNNWTATCGTSVASIDITAAYVKNT